MDSIIIYIFIGILVSTFAIVSRMVSHWPLVIIIIEEKKENKERKKEARTRERKGM
jgi:hypothetical protein